MKVIAALLLVLAGCHAAPPGRGGEPPTIVSLNPCADAILAEITAPGQLLAISHYSHDPAASSMPLEDARAFPATGGTAEEVIALAPDIVVADTFLAPATRRAFTEAGIRVETVGIAGSLEDSIGQVRYLGEVSGQRAAGVDMAHRLEQEWAAPRWPGEPVSALLIQQGDIVSGRGSLSHALLDRSGFSSLSVARGMGQGAYLPLEQVLADPPRVLIVAGSGRLQSHPVLRRVAGMQTFSLDPSLLYCGGPTIPRALDRLAEIRQAVG